MDSTPLAERAERDDPEEVLTPAHFETLRSNVNYHARRVAGLAPDPVSDVEDLRQDLFLDAWAGLPRFDSNRGSWSTFIGLRVKHAAWDLVAERARKRKRAAQWLRDVDPATSVQSPVRHDIEVSLEHPSEEPFSSVELSVDLKRVIETFPDHLQRLCRVLQHESAVVAQQQCGLSPAEFYRQRQDINMRLRARGLSPL